MRERAEWRDVEDRIGIFAILKASFRKDDSDDVNARAAKKWNRGRVGKELERRNVSATFIKDTRYHRDSHLCPRD